MKNRRPPCLDWREKLALRHEDLSTADQQALNAHVNTCAVCAEALADYHFFEARLDALPPPAIKPLPRLSPHFFLLSSEDLHEGKVETGLRNSPAPAPLLQPERRPRKVTHLTWRALGLVAVLCLLLATGVLFRQGYLSRLASHPLGDTRLNLNQHTGAIYAVGWSPDGQEIATASSDGTVKVWNAQSGSVTCTYVDGDAVYALAWSPDGGYIADGSGDDTVKVFRASDCSSVKTYTGHSSVVMSVAWSPNGKYLAAGSSDHTALVWDASSGKTLLDVTSFTDYVVSVAWSPDNAELAIGSWDQTVQVWNLAAQKQVHAQTYDDAVNAVAWSPDGKYLAIANQDNTVEVRNVASWSVVCHYTQHTSAVNALAWSPDGKYLASGSTDHTVRIWNPFESNTPTLMVYNNDTSDISSVAWSPNGKELVSGSFDHTAKVWEFVD